MSAESSGLRVPNPAVESEGAEQLPELELTQVNKSQNKIEKANANFVQGWKNYTIVGLKNSELQIFDENGNTTPKKLEFDLNWSYAVSYKNTIRMKGSSLSADYLVKNLPLVLKEIALHRAEGRDSISIRELENVVSKIKVDPTRCVFIEQGAYAVFPDPFAKTFACFKVENESGVAQSPRDWRLAGLYGTAAIPETAEPVIEKLLAENSDVRRLNDKYSAVVNEIGINIVPGSDVASKSKPLFTEEVPMIGKNVTPDPVNPNIIYYSRGSNPDKIYKLDMSGDPASWKKEEAALPRQYSSITNFQLDPNSKIFLFNSGEDLVMVDKESLVEVKRVPGLSHVNFDADGRIRALDKEGFAVTYQPNFDALDTALEARRMKAALAGLAKVDVFSQAAKKKEQPVSRARESLEPLRAQYEEQFRTKAATVDSQEGMELLRQGLEILRANLVSKSLKPEEREFILEGALKIVEAKEREIATKTAREVLDAAKQAMAAGLSLASISDARAALDRLKPIEPLLDDTMRGELRNFSTDVDQKSKEIFRQKSEEIVKDIEGLLHGVQSQLEGFTRKSDFDDWQEFRLPQLNARLATLLHDCPLEAEDAYKAITKARTDLRTLANTYEEKFKREYAQVREQAAERIDGMVDAINHDIDALIERSRAKGFTDRKDAEQYLEASEARKAIEVEIKALERDNPDTSKELDRLLKARMSTYLSEVERGGRMNIAETGQQMIMFGEAQFPRWEAKVRQAQERRVEVVFAANESSQGPGIRPGQVYGDVEIAIQGSHGEREQMGLYEGLDNEDEWRLGLMTYRGHDIPPSYISAEDYKTVKKDYADWSRGEGSSLRKELEEKRGQLQAIYAERQKVGERDAADTAWQERYRTALEGYAKFYAEHHIGILRRIDTVKAEPETEFKNGKGYVPEWQAHWTQDPHTEQNLEDMATLLKMQLDLQEGLLDLKGHAGTGKDVLIKMFSSLTNRPYFGFDCTKWTTEYELSEDVVLESKDGASQTVKVPSTILNGITTPGAIVYLNEMNAMPEQAQIFLHSLMDEKRALTLKTSSGQVVRAHPSVLLVGSMNPNYPGTFEPQFATRSRMVSLEIGYPPLRREKDPGDRVAEAPYDASEALRIAREVDSLNDLTYEANIQRNDFVRMWDKYVNGIDNGAQEPNPTQKYDIEVTLALVQFANRLREDFIKVFEKTRQAKDALPVTQPITGRELRRCAYALNKIPAAEKTNLAGAESTAKELLDRFYLSHFDKKEDKDKIRAALATWTSKHRVGV